MSFNLTLIAQAVTFTLFIWFTVKFVWPPLLRAIETRQKTIADGLAAAERGKNELELAGKRSTEVLRDAKHQSSDIVAQAEKRAAQIVEEAKNAAKIEGDRLIAGARAQIEQEVFHARESLRQKVAGLVVAGAEKILEREVDAKAHADLLGALEKQL